jgi:hypothetical protein
MERDIRRKIKEGWKGWNEGERKKDMCLNSGRN